MNNFPDRIKALSPEKQALLSLRLKKQRQRENQKVQKQAIQRRETREHAPLSFSQQRMWFLNELEPHNPFYNEPLIAGRLVGPLQIEALLQALNEILRRHESLRTVFTSHYGEPQQCITDVQEVPFTLVDLTTYPHELQEEAIQELARKEALIPFDLSVAPLIRGKLLQLHEQEAVLLLSRHHITSDTWSSGIILQEVSLLYKSFSQHKPSPLLDLSIQYADFATWQRDSQQQEMFEQQQTYWKNQLADAPQILELPTSHPRASIQQFRGGQQYLHLASVHLESLRELARQEKTTLFVVLLAAFQTFLYRSTNQEDFLVGTPISGRTSPEVEPLIGFFSNTLVLRAQFYNNPTLRQFIQQVKKMSQDALAHQDIPFEQVVEALQPGRDLSRMPLVQVMFIYDNTPPPTLELPGLHITPMVVESGTSKFDFAISIEDKEHDLQILCEYNNDLFEPPAVQRMLSHFQTLLESISTHTDQRVTDLPFLPKEEWQRMTAWNLVTVDYPQDKCVHTLFEEQVRKQPAALAAICGTQSITYQELNQRANQLARYLQDAGVGPNVIVGLCVERSLDLLIALMSTLKAGGAYLPLDPTYPSERLAFMLEDSNITVLLTQSYLQSYLPEHRARSFCLDTDWERIQQYSTEQGESLVQPEDLIYVIYTSGSTGRPKGVMLDHRGRVNNFTDFNRRFAVNAQDRILALSSVSFDMFAYDVFGTLSAGARIILPEASRDRDLPYLADLLVRHEVSIWHSVPALLDLLVHFVSSNPSLHPRQLRLVLLGGDWIPVMLPDKVRSLAEPLTIVSMGGATECSMDSTIYIIEEVDPSWKSIPYGHPMANQTCYVFNASLQPVPYDVPGELYLGGAGVAWGYLNCPDLTAEKFIPHPFPSVPGERLYKTGDLVCHRAGGELDLLGRIDYQVKIRGLRIELGEIEAALRRHPSIQDAVVVTNQAERTKEKYLAAYIVLCKEEILHEPDLREYLHNHLPTYMIPARFLSLLALPLTPNGKVDRRNLPTIAIERSSVQEGYVKPRNLVEQTLVDCWSQALSLEQVGIHDNFFSIGGDSILSIQTIALAHQRGIRMTAKHVFQYQTIAELAKVVEIALISENDTALQPIHLTLLQERLLQQLGADVEDAYPLSPMQHNMLTHILTAPQSGLYIVQSYYFLPGDLDIAAFEQAWQLLLQHHAILRTTIAWQGLDTPLQIVWRDVKFTIEQQDWSDNTVEEQEYKIDALLEAQRAQAFTLTSAPLMRGILIRRSRDLYQFFKIDHYLLLDAWSEFYLRKELFDCYSAFSQHLEPECHPEPAFKDYIAWIAQQDLVSAQTFWQEYLADYAFSELLLRRTPARALSENEKIYTKQAIQVSEEVTTQLRNLTQHYQVTLNTLIQGAWFLVLSHMAGKKDVLIGVTSSGRPAQLPDIESMTGLLINTLPVRVKISADTSLVEWLRDLQRQQLEIRQYEYTPLLQLRAWCQVPPMVPLFESIIVYENYPIDPSIQALRVSLPGTQPIIEKDYSLAQTEFPIRVDVGPGVVIQLSISYYRALFDDHIITHILHNFQQILKIMMIVKEPQLADIVESLSLQEQDHR